MFESFNMKEQRPRLELPGFGVESQNKVEMTVDWIGKNYEGPTTEAFVGFGIEDARQRAAAMAEIEIIREMDREHAFTFDHRATRLSLLVVGGVVVAAAMC